MRIPHHQRVPDAVGPPKVEHQSQDHQQITKERSQNGWADDGLIALQIEYMHGRRDRETTGGESDAAKDIEANPQAPRELVAQIGRSPQSLDETLVSSVRAESHQYKENAAPES